MKNGLLRNLHASRMLILSLTLALFFFSSVAQIVNVSIVNPNGVNVCDTSVLSYVEVTNISNAVLTDGLISITFPEGIEYEVSSLDETSRFNMLESSIENLAKVSFSLGNIPANDTLKFSFAMLANMAAIDYQNEGNVFRNILNIEFAEGSTQKTSNAYNLYYPVLSIIDVSPSSKTINSGENFTRDITIVNAGNGRVSEFFITDSHIDGIEVDDINIGTLSDGNSTITLSANAFEGVGNNDSFFDSNESMTITESISASGCQEATISSTIVNGWGCESSILGSNNYAHVTVSLKTPNLSVSTSSELPACFGSGTLAQQSITISNIGEGLADDVVLDIYKSLGNGYSEDIYSRIESESITYQVNGGDVVNITPRESYETSTSNGYSCLGSNPIGRVLLDLPDLSAGDQIVVNFETYHCNISVCDGDIVQGWEYTLDYADFCQQNEYNKSDEGQDPNQTQMSMFSETPTDINDGAQETFSFTVSTHNNDLPVGDGAKYKVQFDLEAGLKFIDLAFVHNLEWEASGIDYDEQNSMVTAYYELPLPSGFNITKAFFNLTLEGDCNAVGAVEGERNIGLNISYIPDASCATEIPFICDENTAVDLHCPGGACNGMSFYNFTLERTSFGMPDNDLDGLPDNSGELDFTYVKKNRAMYGDTLLGTFYGKVNTTTNGTEWDYGFASQDIALGTYLTPIGASIKVFDASANTYETAQGLTVATSTSGDDKTFTYTLNVNELVALNPDFTGYKYAEGDSIWVYASYRVSKNLSNNVLQVKSTNEFYLSDNSTAGSGTKYQCGYYNDHYTLIGYFFKNASTNYFTVSDCYRTVYQDFLFSIGNCCSNYNGGNLFPYEYRYWSHLKSATIEIPDNYSLDNVSFRVGRTKKTNTSTYERVYNVEPISVEGNLYTFDLESYYLSGDINYSDDGYRGTLFADLSPSCDVPQNSYQNITWKFNAQEAGILGGGITADVESSSPDRIRFAPPTMKLTSENPIVDGLSKEVAWDLKVATSASTTDAAHAWIHIKAPKGDIEILRVINDETGDEIALTGDIYQLGDVFGGSPIDLTIIGTYSACTPDYMTVYCGYECTGYPATFADFNCGFTTLGLYVEPKPAKMQVSLFGENIGDDCSSTISLELDINSAKFASVDSVLVTFESSSESIAYIPGSGEMKYPESETYESVTDPSVVGEEYTFSLAELNATIGEDGIPGVLDLDNNHVFIKFSMALDDNFMPGDYVKINVSGKAICGEDIPSINLEFDPSVGFSANTTAGITNTLTNSWSNSWGDYNNDGYDDLFVTSYDKNQANYLYKNNGDKTFTRITSGDIVNDLASSVSATWGDYNNDGFIDLFVANNVGFNNFLYKNNGDGTFETISAGAPVEDGVYCHSAAWGDFDNDGYLDLFVSEYFPTKTNHLFHNNGDGTFTAIEGSPVVTDAGHSIGAAWGDYNNDGLVDLFVPNTENESNWLYKNIGNGSFVKVNEDVVSTPSNSVGCSWGDFNNDTYLDLFIANSGNEANFLYQNNGDGTFTAINEGDIVNEMGNSHGSTWIDMDNDAWLDLYVTNDGDQDNYLYRNDGDGTFTMVENAMTLAGGNSFGTSVSDYDNDGDYDLFVSNHSGSYDFFFDNTKGQCNEHLCMTFQGITSNASGIGVKVKAKANIYGEDVWQLREVSAQSGGGAGGQNSMKVIFGLGDALVIDSLVVQWPSGYQAVYTNVDANTGDCTTYVEGVGTRVCGIAYLDENLNCVYDEGETLLKNTPIEVYPNKKRMYTDENGEYAFYLNIGEYSLKTGDYPYYYQNCPSNDGAYAVNITEINGEQCGYDFGFSTSVDKPDLAACLSTTMLRVNFSNIYTVTYENLGTKTAYNNTIIMNFDEGIDIVSSTLPWDSEDGQTLTWSIASIEPQEHVTFYVKDSVTSNVTLGEFGTNTVSIMSETIEADYTNNGCEDAEEYVGSIDPNDKLVYPEDAVTQGEYLRYKIRFQNVGNFRADHVEILDTLSDKLDVSTIKNVQTSHISTFTITEDNVLQWEFPEINLPDSISNEPESHGYVQFEILPKQSLKDYETIENSAMIIFDYFQQTKTNTTEVVVEPEEPNDAAVYDFDVYPNPVISDLFISFISDSEKEITIRILNAMGQVVETLHYKAHLGYNNYKKAVDNLPAGTYFVSIVGCTSNNTKLFIVQDH